MASRSSAPRKRIRVQPLRWYRAIPGTTVTCPRALSPVSPWPSAGLAAGLALAPALAPVVTVTGEFDQAAFAPAGGADTPAAAGLGSAGLGSAGLGSAGLGSAGLGSASFGSAGFGTGRSVSVLRPAAAEPRFGAVSPAATGTAGAAAAAGFPRWAGPAEAVRLPSAAAPGTLGCPGRRPLAWLRWAACDGAACDWAACDWAACDGRSLRRGSLRRGSLQPGRLRRRSLQPGCLRLGCLRLGCLRPRRLGGGRRLSCAGNPCVLRRQLIFLALAKVSQLATAGGIVKGIFGLFRRSGGRKGRIPGGHFPSGRLRPGGRFRPVTRPGSGGDGLLGRVSPVSGRDLSGRASPLTGGDTGRGARPLSGRGPGCGYSAVSGPVPRRRRSPGRWRSTADCGQVTGQGDLRDCGRTVADRTATARRRSARRGSRAVRQDRAAGIRHGPGRLQADRSGLPSRPCAAAEYLIPPEQDPDHQQHTRQRGHCDGRDHERQAISEDPGR